MKSHTITVQVSSDNSKIDGDTLVASTLLVRIVIVPVIPSLILPLELETFASTLKVRVEADALFDTKGHTVEDNTNIADSDIDEKDEWSDSPTPAKGTKMITFSDINELSYLKKLTDDKLWDQYIVEENYDSFVESETEVHNESIENESASEAEGKTKEMIGLRNYKTDLSDQKHYEKKLYKEMSDLKNHKTYLSNQKHLNDQTIQTHDKKKLYERDDDLSRYISFLYGGEKSFGCSICKEFFTEGSS